MYYYFNNCVSWPKNKVNALLEMVDNAIEISRKTFIKHVSYDDLMELGRGLGYSDHHKQGLTMAQDWYISYHRGKLEGQRVYFLKHSCIEYVFKKGE